MTGRSREVAHLMKRRRIEVLWKQETRWKGAKAKEIGEGVKLFYNGEDTKRKGVGIAVAEGPDAPSTKRKDEFYLTLEDAMRSVPEGDYLSVAGDMNGHVGCRRRGVERVHGGEGVGMVNPDGERIIELAVVHDLVICSTFFAKRESQKVTYASGGRRTEVDHIVVRRPDLKTVRDVKVLPGEEVASQHRPLIADLNIPLPDGGGCGAQSATS
ncbi:unnamed protein product [Heligmosomoides polygyrus]|uniref:Endo/exonuclease/phosphatase domain-containing protein n=1 Tax=Heligmosomoides polygyrus TaxID=6339 RepID=A0A183FZA8_HELPZ|nr:unnamed protein product [Heligmosomoides polygyrus]